MKIRRILCTQLRLHVPGSPKVSEAESEVTLMVERVLLRKVALASPKCAKPRSGIIGELDCVNSMPRVK